MAADLRGATLAVLLAPSMLADEVLAQLTDYSAVGLLDPFVWFSIAGDGQNGVPATLVADGRSSAVMLKRVLTARRYGRLRVAALVPVEAPADQRIPRASEQALEQVVRGCAVKTPITLLRLLFTQGAPAPQAPYTAGLVLEG
jgi:hypothetical protein